MKFVFNIRWQSKKSGDVIDINPFYVKKLLAEGIVSPVKSGDLLPEAPAKPNKPKRKRNGNTDNI